MSATERIRVTITWSKDTDLALRSYLGAQGVKRGGLSRFVEDAVKWRLFDQTVDRVRDAFADVPTDDVNKVIDEAIASVRREKQRKGKPHWRPERERS